MGKEQPIKMYFLITVLLFIVLVYFGLMLRNFLSEKFSSEDSKKIEETRGALPDEVQQARAAWTAGFLIFVTMIVIFATFKLATRRR
mgnify:CR=1 FL=1